MRHNPVLLRPMSIVIPDPKTSVIRNLVIALTLFATLLATLPARALEPIPVPIDVEALDITNSVDLHREAGTRLQVSTAPGADGIVRRIEVPSRDGTNTNWAVFALANTSDEQIDQIRKRADMIEPRPEASRHPLTELAAGDMRKFLERAARMAEAEGRENHD